MASTRVAWMWGTMRSSPEQTDALWCVWWSVTSFLQAPPTSLVIFPRHRFLLFLKTSSWNIIVITSISLLLLFILLLRLLLLLLPPFFLHHLILFMHTTVVLTCSMIVVRNNNVVLSSPRPIHLHRPVVVPPLLPQPLPCTCFHFLTTLKPLSTEKKTCNVDL